MMAEGRKESVSEGVASGHQTVSAREREWRILSPINLSSLGFIYFTLFAVFFPPTPVYTNCVPSTPLLYAYYALLSMNPCYCSGLTRGGQCGLKTSNLFLSLAVRVTAVSFHLLYNNCTVYTCNSSVKCVCCRFLFFSSASVLLPLFFTASKIICCIPTE